MARVHGGLLKNITRRALISQGLKWWGHDSSPWKLTTMHDPVEEPDGLRPDYWMSRVLNLCEVDLTHQYYGLTFNDLMHMDPSTFEFIEKRVNDFLKRKQEAESPEIKKAMQNYKEK